MTLKISQEKATQANSTIEVDLQQKSWDTVHGDEAVK